jgi:hypothetical protein
MGESQEGYELTYQPLLIPIHCACLVARIILVYLLKNLNFSFVGRNWLSHSARVAVSDQKPFLALKKMLSISAPVCHELIADISCVT